MSMHEFLDDELREQAALYVLRSLSEDDARAWRLHLGQCPTCRAEVEALERVAGELTAIAPAAEPPPQLWSRVLARVRACAPEAHANQGAGQVWKSWPADEDAARPFTYVDGSQGSFEPTSFAGVSARRLFVDLAQQRVTMIVRMQPGSSYPAHRHSGPEECYVLQGDLDTGQRHMQAGDFERSAAGSRHAVQSTQGGCVLFIVSSLGDEILA
jgi:putative transcriptional regulator